MAAPTYPKNFRDFRTLFPEMFEALEKAARLARESGPLDEKSTHLVQLAAAIARRSEGSTHSHARRALEAGATREELYQVINLLVSTVGFPTAAAAFSWVSDVLEGRQGP
ncbi:MAG: carboxymuconolactone decarboxylase family protein [Deferrisomatales bacterium]|nr:carboxymuconolactone decarboxylase family protein [Deferrisomatales bacterium]